MKAVVIGGCGHIGTYLVPMLINAGYETVSVTRGQSKPYEYDIAWEKAEKVQLDRSNNSGFTKKIADMNADIVVDLINFRIEDTKDMVAALKDSRISHYLFCSSVWAHGRAEMLPFNPDDIKKEALDEYGENKFQSELYLKDEYRINYFPATIIMPGQISGPGWTIMNPWANKTAVPFQKIANGEEIFLPNFGMETLHHVHGYDVAQVFFKAIEHRNQALGETFHAVSGQSITLYGYAKLMYGFFGKEPKIDFMQWDKWCEYVGDETETSDTYYHIARSGYFSIEKEKKLLDYRPKYTNIDTIKLAVQSYIDRGLIKI
nr:NAD-dependent epimerase/dehydratase family protein [uncultured Clostridium sp.]